MLERRDEIAHAQAAARAAARGGADAATSAVVVAPMPGKVVRLLVAEGELAKAGEPVAILEAMKMEHAVPAPCDGRVSALLATPGETVDDGAALVEIGGSNAT